MFDYFWLHVSHKLSLRALKAEAEDSRTNCKLSQSDQSPQTQRLKRLQRQTNRPFWLFQGRIRCWTCEFKGDTLPSTTMKPTTALCCFGFLLTFLLFGSSSSQSGEWTPSICRRVRSSVSLWSCVLSAAAQLSVEQTFYSLMLFFLRMENAICAIQYAPPFVISVVTFSLKCWRNVLNNCSQSGVTCREHCDT